MTQETFDVDTLVSAVASVDTRGTMRPTVRDRPWGKRVQLGNAVDSFLFVSRSGLVGMSPAVPLRWRRPIRLALQDAGVQVRCPRDVPGPRRDDG